MSRTGHVARKLKPTLIHFKIMEKAHIFTIIRLSSLGDIALLTGVIKYFHEQFGYKFNIITREEFLPLFDNNPAVNTSMGLKKIDLKNWFTTAKKIKQKFGHTKLIDVHRNLRTFILCAIWPTKTYKYNKLHFTRLLFLYTRSQLASKKLCGHNIAQRYALALNKIVQPAEKLLPKIFLTQEEKNWANNILKQQITIAIHPYASYVTKQWPTEYWLQLINLLTAQKINWIILGKNDSPLIPKHESDFTNKTNLRQISALINASTVLVSADSGPMHMALGLNTKIISLFGCTTKEWGFFPTSNQNNIVITKALDCAPCSLHGNKPCTKKTTNRCMLEITPQEVFTAIQSLINK